MISTPRPTLQVVQIPRTPIDMRGRTPMTVSEVCALSDLVDRRFAW